MDWFRAVNSYCERTDASYWSEPVNALTNLAFVLAAAAVWPMARRVGDGAAMVLCLILAAIGVGSFLFHTHAQLWAMMADVIPIQVFILVYVAVATTRFFALPWWAGLLAAAAFVPLSAGVARLIVAGLGPLNGSASYAPVPLLILAYAGLLARSAPATARGLAAGALLLTASLVFRTIDEAVCPAFPLGTHFLWHLLNAVMLGWMIAVLARFPVESVGQAGRQP